jgi:NAD+ synthase
MREYPAEFSKEAVVKFHPFLVDFIKRIMQNKGFSKIVLGMSGGADSTLGAYLATEALGKDNIFGFLMPYKTSQPDSVEHAEKAAKNLGIEYQKIDITPMIDAYFVRFPGADDLRRGNKMARERMSILYDQAKAKGALVIGTSNKTEYMLGYGTIFGDMASAFNPLGAIYKTEVWMLGELVGVPDFIIDKKPTADLWEGQTDEGDMGIDYYTADRILYYLIEEKREKSEIEKLGIPKKQIEKVISMISASEFKRKLPDVPVLTR